MSKSFATLAAALLFVGAAYAHGTVETATPKDGSTLSSSPPEIRLRFTEPVELTFTSIKLVGPAGQEVATAEKARVDDGKTVV